MYSHADVILLFNIILAGTSNAGPVRWTRSQVDHPRASTIVRWPGHTKIPGAFIISRVNLEFINKTCTKLSDTLSTAARVSTIIINSNLRGTSANQIKQYGYMMLRVEADLQNTLEYVTNLLLCSGRGGELWGKLTTLKKIASDVWKLLRAFKIYNKQPFNFPNRIPLNIKTYKSNANRTHNETLIEISQINSEIIHSNELINILEQHRSQIPTHSYPLHFSIEQKPRALFAVGAGLGFLGGLFIDKIFGDDSQKEIGKLNDNLSKHNKLIKLTNERIDILANNISRSNQIMKTILEKLVENDENRDIHHAILWNLDQLVVLNAEIKNTFRLGELTLTLLDQGILNPELIQLNSLKTIVSEGLQLFPAFTFPVKITRYQLDHVVKLLKVQRLGKMKFIMIVPLTDVSRYETFTLISHPIKIGKYSLALPKTKNIILKNQAQTYIITTKEKLYSISNSQHILLEVEPIYKQSLMTCEWAAFKKSITDMIKLCDFGKAGEVNDTFVIETDKNRLVYFTTETEVELNCPGKQINSKLSGLHEVSLACDIKTKQVHWPSKQTAIIDIKFDDTTSFDATELPIANIDKSSNIHSSLREIIDKIPKRNESFTIDFDHYDLTIDQIQTYTIFSQTALTLIVCINSLAIGYILFKWKRDTPDGPTESTMSGNQFRRINDSLRQLRRNIRSQGSSIKGKIETKFTESPTVQEPESTGNMNGESKQSPQKQPALPRYR